MGKDSNSAFHYRSVLRDMKLTSIPEIVHSFPEITDLEAHFSHSHIKGPFRQISFQINLTYEGSQRPVGVLRIDFQVPAGKVEHSSDYSFQRRFSGVFVGENDYNVGAVVKL